MASNQRQNITAIIYDKRGRILSIGKNSYQKTHTIQSYFSNRCNEPHKIVLHAEIDAIIKCKNLDRAHRIFVSRIMANGSYGIAKPCKICSLALSELTKIKIIEHT